MFKLIQPPWTLGWARWSHKSCWWLTRRTLAPEKPGVGASSGDGRLAAPVCGAGPGRVEGSVRGPVWTEPTGMGSWSFPDRSGLTHQPPGPDHMAFSALQGPREILWGNQWSWGHRNLVGEGPLIHAQCGHSPAQAMRARPTPGEGGTLGCPLSRHNPTSSGWLSTWPSGPVMPSSSKRFCS